jgi:hypothetical protein
MLVDVFTDSLEKRPYDERKHVVVEAQESVRAILRVLRADYEELASDEEDYDYEDE